VLLDVNGNPARARQAIFVIRDGMDAEPKGALKQPGIRRQATIDLAAELRSPSQRTDIDSIRRLHRRRDLTASTSLMHLRVRRASTGKHKPSAGLWPRHPIR